MERGKMPSSSRGGKSKAPQHPQDIFALGSKSTVPVSRDAEKRSIHKPSTSGVERKREPSFGSQPPNKRARIGSPAEAVGGTSLEVEPVDLVPNVLQALDTHNSDKLLGLLTGSIRLLKSQRSKPDPILCMGLLYLTKIRPNMFAHETVTNTLCTLLKREQGAAFKNKGNPLVFVLACNMLYAGHRDSNNWPDIFIKVYIEDALNERWWVECSWCKCLVENIVTAFGTKQPPSHLIPTDNTLGTMSPSGSGSPLMGSTEDDTDNSELEYTVFPRYSSSYEAVEGMVLEAIKDQIQRRSAAPDAIGKGFLKLLSATCGFPEIRMISASRLEAWLNSGKLWRVGQELLAYVCVNCDALGPTAARDHEVLAQLARMRLKTKPLQAAYQACLREMVSESPALLRSVVTHTIYNELSNVRSPNNMAVLAALIHAQPNLVPAAMADTYLELLLRPEEYLRPLRALTREVVRGAREAGAAGALARALASPPPHEAPPDRRERAFLALTDLICCCALLAASGAAHTRASGETRTALASLAGLQGAALGWLLDTAVPCYRPARHDFLHALNKIMFVEPMETYSKVDNWPPESERAHIYRMCCEAPLPQNNLLRLIFLGLSKEIPISPAEVFELVEQVVRRACALPPEDSPLQLDKLEIADYIFQLCQFNPPDNITLPQGYTPPALAITSLYWRGWVILTMLAAHNPLQFAERAAATYPTLRALIETCITNRPSLEWTTSTAAETERNDAERATILQLETHLAAASNSKLPVTEHSSRLLSQLTTLEPLGPARKPPASVLESLAALSQQLRLGKLLCRQPALLLSLVERHGTRRAMPWLHQLLRQDQLELSVLPVQCLCEFLSAGAGAGAGEGKAGELCLHLRRTLHDTEEGARALLHYYLTRLAHHHAHTRASATRGLKLVLQSEDATEMDYTADVSPQEWLHLLWDLRHWGAVRMEAVARIRAACLVECVPGHVAAYIHFLARFVREEPHRDHTDIVLDLSQVLMERTSVMTHVVGAGEHGREPCAAHHRALHDLTHIFYVHLQKLFSEGPGEEPAVAWGVGERVSLLWPSGRRAVLHTIIAHAHLKLLCLGPSMLDSNQEMYTWLQQVWFGADAPQAFLLESSEEAHLLPDWLRLHLVRSARPPLLEAGLRALPAHKLALFIQTFGMPVPAMSALLKALDACPAGAVVRLGVERGYMSQLLRVQRARGAHGGAAFASALRLQPVQYPPDDNLFAEEPLPEEMEDDWGTSAAPRALALELVPPVLSTAFGNQRAYMGDLDTAVCDLLACITEEVSRLRVEAGAACPYMNCVISFLQLCAGTPGGALGLVRRPACAAALLRALLPLRMQPLPEIASALLVQCRGRSGPVVSILQEMADKTPDTSVVKREKDTPHVPQHATKEQLIALLESATPSTLEAIGNKIIETQESGLVVDVISHLLEQSQGGHYEIKVKSDEECSLHVLGRGGRGCGLLLDWVSSLQREAHPRRQMRLMFRAGGAPWRPLLVTLLAHRASAATLHHCLAALLQPHGEWSPTAVLDFAETLIGSPRVWQGRDKATPKHAAREDTLRLQYTQLDVLIRYVIREAEEASATGGMEAMRRRIESRLPLVLACCSSSGSLLACALRAAEDLPMLLLLLYMKVPKIRQLMQECEERPPVSSPLADAVSLRGAAAASTSACDAVSHTILTAIPHHQHHTKEHSQKVWRMEAGIRSVWCRGGGAGARALPLAAALLRGTMPLHAKHNQYLLSAIEALPDDELFDDDTSDDLESILECFLHLARAAGRDRDTALAHRVAALLRRYLAARPHRAAQLLHLHQHIIQSIPALSALQTADISSPASASPPPHALLALQRRSDTPENLHWNLQEIEMWGSRRGGGWGGAACAGAVLRCTAPFAASPYAPLRSAALSLLAKLLPCVTDTKPGLQAILECLESPLPEVSQSCLEALPTLVCGAQEHGARLLMRVFELGVRSRLPVETCIANCVAAINVMRGC